MPITNLINAASKVTINKNHYALYDQTMQGNRMNIHFLRNHEPIVFDTHNHGFYEIVVVLNGKLKYTVEGRNYDLCAGDIMLINKLEFHSGVVSASKPYERFTMWFHPDLLQNWSNLHLDVDLQNCFKLCTQRQNNLLRLDAVSFSKLVYLAENMCQLFDEMQENDSYNSALLYAMSFEFLVRLNIAYNKQQDASKEREQVGDPKFNDLIAYINTHLDEELGLDFLAQKFGFSKYHMARAFKEYIGMTIHQFVINKRLLQGKYLIELGVLPTKAYLDCGFNDYSNFSRTFKQKYGILPSKLHEQAMSTQ